MISDLKIPAKFIQKLKFCPFLGSYNQSMVFATISVEVLKSWKSLVGYVYGHKSNHP